MNTIRNIGLILAYAASATGIGGCAASLPPQDLLNARSVYDQASKGQAEQLDPADMHVAKEQLNVAETSFRENGDTQGTRDQAYLAVRKTELAEVVARTMAANQTKDGVVDAMHQDEKRTVALTAAELARQKSQFATQGAAMKAQGAELSAQGVKLEDEKTRRLDAEKRAAQAAADLAKFASVKQEARGMVITLSGSVLFASAKWDLLPEAQLKLNDVATALIKEDPLSTMVVEGHTDSQGGVPYNQDLSQHRAQAVRDYLVSRGIASDRITAQGFASSRSVADNASPEGRANNRRVEIVVKPATPAN
jgi:outer membrane protein OmpA-like peptidoglycan-associated protein